MIHLALGNLLSQWELEAIGCWIHVKHHCMLCFYLDTCVVSLGRAWKNVFLQVSAAGNHGGQNTGSTGL